MRLRSLLGPDSLQGSCPAVQIRATSNLWSFLSPPVCTNFSCKAQEHVGLAATHCQVALPGVVGHELVDEAVQSLRRLSLGSAAARPL